MASDELKFLRDQVRRLNAVLVHYQTEQRQELNINMNSLPDAPWQVDHNQILPLLKEYDDRIDELTSVIDHYKREQKNLRGELEVIIADNQCLTRELKLRLQDQQEDLDENALTPDLPGDEQVLINLQNQLEEAVKEKESSQAMLRQALSQIEKMEQILATNRPNVQAAAWEAQASQIHKEYKNTVTDLTNENHVLHEELQLVRSEFHASQLQVAELRALLEEMKTRLKFQEQEKSFITGDKKRTASQLNDLHRQQTAVEAQNAELQRQNAVLKKEKNVLEERLLDLKKKRKEEEDSLYSIQEQMRESVQLVEAALLEKEQAMQREQQASEEVDRLNSALNNLLEEAGARTRQEVDHIKQQCNQNISRLMEELENLETASNEKQVLLDRLLREKRSVESELDKLHKEDLSAQNLGYQSVEHLNQKLFDMEQKRDEAMMKVDSLEQQIKRLQLTHEQENGQYKSEIDQLNQRLVDFGQMVDLGNDDKVGLINKMDELKTKVQKLQLERDAAVREKSKQLSLMEQEMHEQAQEYNVRLQTLEDSQRQTVEELRNMLNAQQRMSAKWKEECNTVTQNFDCKMRDMRDELSREKKRNTELSRLLKNSTDKMAETQSMLAEYSQHIQRMEERIRNSEARQAYTGSVGANHQRSQVNLIERKKQLQRQLAQLHKEIRDEISPVGVNMEQRPRDSLL